MSGPRLKSVKTSESSYFALLNSGATPQIARSVLPTCLKTEIRVTANLREWRHIINLRTGPRAHPQIREVMDYVLMILYRQIPVLFDDLIVQRISQTDGVEFKGKLTKVIKRTRHLPLE